MTVGMLYIMFWGMGGISPYKTPQHQQYSMANLTTIQIPPTVMNSRHNTLPLFAWLVLRTLFMCKPSFRVSCCYETGIDYFYLLSNKLLILYAIYNCFQYIPMQFYIFLYYYQILC